MRTRLVSMAALLALLGSGFAGAQAPVPAPGRLAVFKTGVDVVNLAVTVTDPKGRFVTDLGEGDFEVLEEGVRQPLTIFTREDLPVSLAILIDTSASMDAKLSQAQTAAVRFVKTLHSADEAQVVQFSQRAEAAAAARPLNPDQSTFFFSALGRAAGGQAHFLKNVSQLDGVYDRLAQELRSQYGLGYVSNNPAHDGRWRRVVVRTPAHLNVD